MELFILRHGHAETEAPKDRLRELTATGKLEIQKSIRANKESFDNLELVLASPYVRAQQSADAVLGELGDIPKQDSDLLVPGGHPDALIKFLYALFEEQKKQSVLLVGHQPLLGILLDDLCGLEPGKYRMATASLAALDVGVLASSCCRLRWLFHVTD